jgi:ribosomal-protein-alanine N-acetyltransferase
MDRERDVTLCPPPDDWQLRRVTLEDIVGLHLLACKPLVYQYLFDGTPPSREFIADRVARAIANADNAGLGMWVLESHSTPYAGCVELRPHTEPRSAEITWLLDPGFWGRGLAVRMAWTVIEQAFGSPDIDAIIAGHDLPNAASRAVMLRLGMRFHRDVQYPLGAGAEYILHRDDIGLGMLHPHPAHDVRRPLPLCGRGVVTPAAPASPPRR